MPNMSYCRFENTAMDLDDCQAALEEIINGQGGSLGHDELAAAKRLVKTCLNIAAIVAETGECEVEQLLDDERRVDTILDGVEEAAQ